MSERTATDRTFARHSAMRAVFGLGPLVVGAVLAGAVLYLGFGGRETHFDEFALGEGTTAIFTRVNDQPIHCTGVGDADGCVVGAGAIVMESVPPFAIAAGHPCRVVGRRFSERTICRILEDPWWDHSLEELESSKDVFAGPLEDAS